MEFKTETEVITKSRYTLTTDDIEKIVLEHLGANESDTEFYWDTGQWVELRLTVTQRETENE